LERIGEEKTMNRPKCVDDMMTTIDYVRYLEAENEKIRYSLDVAIMRLEKQGAENTRLHNIILQEGQKWADHHTDPEKKKYWIDFIGKLSQ
jgi:hypothetical protein